MLKLFKVAFSLWLVVTFIGCGGSSDSTSNNKTTKSNTTYSYTWNGENLDGYKIRFTIQKSDGSIGVGYQIIYEFKNGKVIGYNTKNSSTYYPTGYEYIATVNNDIEKADIHIDYYNGSATEDYILSAKNATEGSFTYEGYNGTKIGKASGKYKILIQGGHPFVKDVNITKGLVKLVFSEPLDSATVTSDNIILRNEVDTTKVINDINISLDKDTKTVLLQINNLAKFQIFENYVVDVSSNVKDINNVSVKEEYKVYVKPRGLKPIIKKSLLESTAPKIAWFKGNRLYYNIFENSTFYYDGRKADMLYLKTQEGTCIYDVTDPLDPGAMGCIDNKINGDIATGTSRSFFPNSNWEQTRVYQAKISDYTQKFNLEYASFGSASAFQISYDLRFLPDDNNTYLERYYSVLGLFGKYLLLTTYDDDTCHLNKIDISNLSSENSAERWKDQGTENDYTITLESRTSLPLDQCYRNMEVYKDKAFLYNVYPSNFTSGVYPKNNLRVTNFSQETLEIKFNEGSIIDIPYLTAEASVLKNYIYIKGNTIDSSDMDNIAIYSYNDSNNIQFLGDKGDYNTKYITNILPFNTKYLYDNIYLNSAYLYDFSDPLYPKRVSGTYTRDNESEPFENGKYTNSTRIIGLLEVKGYLYTFRIENVESENGNINGKDIYYLEVTKIVQ